MNILVTSGPIAAIGHNGAPELTPFELSRDEIEDLFLEATNWADGEPVTTAEQEAAIDKLIGLLRDAEKLADARRVEENKPFDEGKAAVQAKFNPLIQPKKGKTQIAIESLKATVAPYRKKIADEKAAAAEKLRLEAEAKRKAAEDAFRTSQVTDLAKRAEAEALLDEAKQAEKVAKKADKVATTGLGLRTTYRAEVTDPDLLAGYCWERHLPAVIEAMTALAQRDVNAGNHSIPGIKVHEVRSAI